jgi:phospholipid-binding lipoprotein MlaA
MRLSIKNFFNNLAFPIRFLNCLLQGKFRSAGDEALRFMLNSTFGMLGMYDVAREEFEISAADEDFGQTLGVWGMKSGLYIHWPFLGPSSIRDTLGYVGDYFVDPINLIRPRISRFAIKSYDKINRVSLKIGEYEKIKQEALDPYTAIRDIYFQYRESKISR